MAGIVQVGGTDDLTIENKTKNSPALHLSKARLMTLVSNRSKIPMTWSQIKILVYITDY